MGDDSPSFQSDSFNVHRRSLLALGAATAVGTGLGTTTVAASNLDVQEDEPAEAGIFLAALTGDQQPESVETDATGGAVFSLSEDGAELEYALLVNGIEDADQAHIHLGGAREDGPVAAWLYPDPGADEPELQDGRFDGVLATDTIADEHVTDAVEGETIDALVEEITDGNAYVNVHTEEHPDGEIRGQLVSVEDAAAALLEGEPAIADIPDDDPDEDDRDDEPDDEEVIQFVDCHTVRIVGDFPEVVIYPLELMEPGDQPGEPDQYLVGAMGSFPVGPVDGERVIDMREEIGQRVVISAVDVLDDEFSVGEAVHERIHPDRDECIEQLFVDAGVEPPDDPFGEVPAADPDDDVPDDEENDEVPADDPEDGPDTEEGAADGEPIENGEDET
ncbi:CHRD domain-containing protein [Natronococcus pandeyae]|nr:CHRD domain-containing protein [Natronococcus pandeyae]